MTAKVYFDGYNLYYGCLRGRPELKWLDLVALARALVKPGIEVVGVEYFTSRVKTYPHDPMAVERQKIYLQALSTLDGLNIIEGFYNKNRTWAPFIEDTCRNCEIAPGGMAHVMKLEEKRTDVNIATSMLWDAFTNTVDMIVLVSGDSDFIGPIDLIRHRLNKQVVVFNPHSGRRTELKKYATYCTDIPSDLLVRCQLPDMISIGTHGNVLRRPQAWH